MGKGARILGGATTGIGRALGSFLTGDQAQQQGYDETMLTGSRIGQALAQMRLHDAQAAEHQAQAGVISNRGALADDAMAAAAGVDVPTLSAYRQKLRTGEAPQVPMGPPAEDGRMGAGRAQFDPQTSTAIGQALLRLAPVLNAAKDINPDQYAKALGAFRGMDLGDQVLGGQRTAGQVGAAQAAVEGKPLFNSDTTGAVLDLFGGRLATDNPMAQSTIGLRGAQAGQAKAAAAENYAQADSARASAAKSRAEMADGVNRGGSKAPTGYRWGADGQTLEAIPGGPADPNTKGAKLAKPPTEGQAKALMFGTRMQAADNILTELQGKYSPAMVATKGAVEQIPVLGGISGATLNMAMSPANQRAEQAQRDFVNAVLRRESGAVISPQEFANAQKQYFPQPGDSPAVLRQKAANRRTAIAGMKAEVGESMLPEFDRVVRQAGGAVAPDGGADWSMPAAPAPAAGWKIERVN